MPKLKAEFRKPKLTLYNTNYVALGVLTNRTHLSAHNIVLDTTVNEAPYITFDIPAGGLINSNSTELLIKHKNDFFVIKEISVSDSETASISVLAEHIACELKGILVGYFEDMIGETPQNMWNTIVDNSTMSDAIRNRYVFDTNIVDTYRYLGYDDEKSVFEFLVSIAQQFDACLLFETDTNGKIHINLLYGDINRNRFIRKGKDLKELDLKFNTESLFTKLTPFGAKDDDGIEINIMDVNNGKSYLTDFSYYLAKGMTQKQIDENPLCNQECIYRNDEILDENELLRLAKEELKRVSAPVVEGSISAIDLHVFEGGLYLSPILCEKIIVIDKDIEYSLSCKITSISLNYDNPLESQIGISNAIKYGSRLKDLVTSSEIVDKVTTNNKNGKPSLDASKIKGIIDGHITQLKYSMENNITDVTSAVILFENRVVGDDMFGALALGSRGLLISQELDKVTNQWVWSTALDSKGLSTQIVNAIEINGGQIKGNTISSYDNTTWINLDNGTFNFKNKIKYIDGKLSIAMKSDGTTTEEFLEEYKKDKEDIQKDIDEVYEAMDTLKDTIDVAINDGIITESELATISNAIIQLNKEKDDTVARYNNIKDNDYLSNEILIKLNEAFNNYIDIHNVLVSFINTIVADRVITETEKGFYKDHSSDYSDKLSKLSVEIDNALSDILENSTAYQVENLKTSLEKDFEDVYSKIDEILDDVGGVIADGIIDEAELLIIKNTIIQLDKEKEDIDMSYSSIHNNNDLNETFKTNLERSHASYTAAHANLKNAINNMGITGEVTNQEKIAFDTATKKYSTALANFKNYATLSLEMITKNYTDAKVEVLEDSISLKVSGSEMTEYVSGIKTSLQNQLDGKIESYYQTTNPGADWTSAERASHKGDIWHNSLSNVTYRWSGTNWIKLTDSDAEEAKALANTKAKIFTATPMPPYNKGDLWVQGTSADGEIMKCNTTRTSGSYIASDWSKASKYTDDTQANNVLNNLTTNYYTIKEADAQINLAKESITSTVSSTYTTKDHMNNTLTNYAKKSDLSQTAESITATFTSSGGGNLVRNGELKNGTKFWTEHPYQLVGSDLNHWWRVQNNSWTGYEPALELGIPNMTSGEYGVYQTIETVVGRQYVLTCYLAGHRGNYYAVVRGTESGGSWAWLTSRAYGHTHGGSNPDDWHKVVIPFVAESTETIIDFHITSSTGNNTYMWVKRIMVCEGTVWSPFVPHSSEVYTGITKIDQDGVEVSHNNINTKSKMSADGFSIIDENGDVISWLTSKDNWTELKADNVYANNIDNVYTGDANLYIDHSKTTAGDGTSDNPFNNFKALADYLQPSPILKKDLVINVVSTGDVTDNLDLRGIRGNGTIRINLAKTLVLNKSSASSAFYFYGCDVAITINGGRTGYDSTDGALLNGFNHGVYFNQCKYGWVEYLAIDTKGSGTEQWGIIFRGTNGRTTRVDFCDTWNAILADFGSNVGDNDSCGNCKNAFYAQSGANIVLGSTEDNGYKPAGNYIKNGGCVTDLGNRVVTPSKRKAPDVPSSSDKWKSFTYTDYGYYSLGQKCWNAYGKRVYQGQWADYGNNMGIFTLPNSSIDAYLSGATIVDGSTITLKRATSGGYSSIQVIYLCGTSHTSIGSGVPPVTKSYGALGAINLGKQQTFTLPKAFVQDLKAGTIKSVMFYKSDGGAYILFDAVCTLNIKVNR